MSLTNFGIQGFYKQAVAKDFTRDFQLRVLHLGNDIITKEDNVYITSATLPGYQINNQTVPFMGLDFNIPGTAKFPGSSGWGVTFRSDAQLNIRQKLINWQAAIFSAFPDSANHSSGAYNPVPESVTSLLQVQDRDGGVARAFELCGIYPVTVGDMSYDQTGGGAVVTFQATLAYQWWTPSTKTDSM